MRLKTSVTPWARKSSASAGSWSLLWLHFPTLTCCRGDGLRNFGLYSELAVFWIEGINTMSIEVERSSSVRKAMPGLGYDPSRLVEVELAPPRPGEPSVEDEWDRARAAREEPPL